MTDPKQVALRLLGKRCTDCVIFWGPKHLCPHPGERGYSFVCSEYTSFKAAFDAILGTKDPDD